MRTWIYIAIAIIIVIIITTVVVAKRSTTKTSTAVITTGTGTAVITTTSDTDVSTHISDIDGNIVATPVVETGGGIESVDTATTAQTSAAIYSDPQKGLYDPGTQTVLKSYDAAGYTAAISNQTSGMYMFIDGSYAPKVADIQISAFSKWRVVPDSTGAAFAIVSPVYGAYLTRNQTNNMLSSTMTPVFEWSLISTPGGVLLRHSSGKNLKYTLYFDDMGDAWHFTWL